MRCLILPLLFVAGLQGQAPTAVPVATSLEKAVVQELSEARWRPKVYAKHLRELRPYFDGLLWRLPEQTPLRTREGVAAVDEAIAFLERVEAVGPLRFNKGLWAAAREHALDQSLNGGVGHVGSRGSVLRARLGRHGSGALAFGECIAYGFDEARMIALQLIIDDGVPDRGHRQSIFNPDFHHAGAAVSDHPLWGHVCVIDFADGFTPLQR